MLVLLKTAESVTGDLSETKTYAARCWTWVPTPDTPDGRLGNLTIELLYASPRSGKVESDTYAVEDGGYLSGLMGRSFWLTNLSDPACTEPYEVVLGPLGRCGCDAGGYKPKSAGSLGCKHRDALAALVEQKLV